VEFANDGFNTILVYIEIPTGGAVAFEMATDGVWEELELRSTVTDTVDTTFTTSGFYLGSVAGAPKLRFRTSTAGSEDGSLDGELSRYVSTIELVEFGNPPHRFGYQPVHFDKTYSTAQTNTVLFAADADKKSVLTDIMVVISGTVDCTATIFDETNAEGNRIFSATAALSNQQPSFIFSHGYVTPFIASAAGNEWKLTTNAACTINVSGHGYQY
jgi:hypothetical protein